MTKDMLRYDAMVEEALRGVVRAALRQTAERGLPGNHHFYLTFLTQHPGVEIPEHLRSRFPVEMTIVLQYQFWGLEVGEDAFTVGLSFNSVPEKLVIPFAAITAFADPSMRFGLQFPLARAAALGTEAEADAAGAGEAAPRTESDRPTPALPGPAEAQPPAGTVVKLDSFRRRSPAGSGS